jgi:hypothetical protein
MMASVMMIIAAAAAVVVVLSIFSLDRFTSTYTIMFFLSHSSSIIISLSELDSNAIDVYYIGLFLFIEIE